jgi:hypothetical protein
MKQHTEDQIEVILVVTSFISGLLGLVMVAVGKPDWAAASFLGAVWLMAIAAWARDYFERWSDDEES